MVIVGHEAELVPLVVGPSRPKPEVRDHDRRDK